MFDLRKSWMYELKASPQACEAAFRGAMTDKAGAALGPIGKWEVAAGRVPSDVGREVPALIATMTSSGMIRGMTRQGRIGTGSTVAFAIDGYDQATNTTSCQMFVLEGRRMKHNNLTPAVIANPDIIKRRMKKVHKRLVALDSQLRHVKER